MKSLGTVMESSAQPLEEVKEALSTLTSKRPAKLTAMLKRERTHLFSEIVSEANTLLNANEQKEENARVVMQLYYQTAAFSARTADGEVLQDCVSGRSSSPAHHWIQGAKCHL